MVDSLVVAKAICAIILAAETILGTLIPIVLRKLAARAPRPSPATPLLSGDSGSPKGGGAAPPSAPAAAEGYKAVVERRVKRAMAGCSAAAAGVFLGVGLCHMQPDAVRYLEGCLGGLHGFPLPYFLVLLGFCLLAFLDKVLTPTHEHHLSHEQSSHPSGTSINSENPSDGTPTTQLPGAWKQRYAKAVVLTLGMAIHAFVTGLALGMSESFDDLMGIALACMCHEWAHAGALVVLYDSLAISKKVQIILLCTYFTVTPSSIAIGTALYAELEGSRAGYISTGVLSAIAAGTFLFIGACELMHEAFEADHSHAHGGEADPHLEALRQHEHHHLHHHAIEHEHIPGDEKDHEQWGAGAGAGAAAGGGVGDQNPIIPDGEASDGKKEAREYAHAHPHDHVHSHEHLDHTHEAAVMIPVHSHGDDDEWLHGIGYRTINYGIMLFFAVGIASVAAIEGDPGPMVC
ncbi:solute carrier family 39 (zinc transporter), member 1/2/3 [Pelomyxa schiedti]|nr:solute carrier family 39 (zinc transporter), member 1/2/3 [Pelomyxa schiedti]